MKDKEQTFFSPFPLDWQETLNKWASQNFDSPHQSYDPSWIQDLIQNVLGNSTGSMSSSPSSSPIQPNVFETLDSMYIRIPIPNKADPLAIRVFLNANQLSIEGLSETQEKKVKLPAIGLHKGSEAVYKDNLLEIKIPKDTRNNFKEIDIRYL